MVNTGIQKQQMPILMICSLNDWFSSRSVQEGPRKESMHGNKELGGKRRLARRLYGLSNSQRSEDIARF